MNEEGRIERFAKCRPEVMAGENRARQRYTGACRPMKLRLRLGLQDTPETNPFVLRARLRGTPCLSLQIN